MKNGAITSDSAMYAYCRRNHVHTRRLAEHKFLVDRLPPVPEAMEKWDYERRDDKFLITLSPQPKKVAFPLWYASVLTRCSNEGIQVRKIRAFIGFPEDAHPVFVRMNSQGEQGYVLLQLSQPPKTPDNSHPINVAIVEGDLDANGKRGRKVLCLAKTGRQESARSKRLKAMKRLLAISRDITRYVYTGHTAADDVMLQESIKDYCTATKIPYYPISITPDEIASAELEDIIRGKLA